MLSKEEFVEIVHKLKNNNIPYVVNSENNALVCGPDIAENIDSITRHLKLVN